MAIDKTGSTENIDSYKRVREPLSPLKAPYIGLFTFQYFPYNSIPKATNREPELLTDVVPAYKAIVAIQVAGPGTT